MELPMTPPVSAPAAAPINAPAPPFRGPPMAAPVTAPTAPPIKAPEAVLFGCPFGYSQPVNTTAETAVAKAKTFNLVFIFNRFNRPVTWTNNHALHSRNFNLKIPLQL